MTVIGFHQDTEKSGIPHIMSDKVECKGCLYWKNPDEGKNWSECMLTAPEAHETLSKVVVYEAITEDGVEYWESRDELKYIVGIMQTRSDYGCVQYEEKNPE